MTNENIKNSLLIGATIEFISKNKNVEDYDAILDSYTNKSTNSDQKQYVNRVVTSLKKLKNGNPLPDGTYYYVLDLGDGNPPRTGFVIIFR